MTLYRATAFGQIAMTAEEEAEFLATQGSNTVFIPKSITMKAARIVLLKAGLLTQATNYINSLEGVEGDLAKIEWEFSTTVERDNHLVKALTVVLGKTEAQIDQMFIDAILL